MSLVKNPFDILPVEDIVRIAFNLDPVSIVRFCSTSKKFNNIICDNNWFWHQKFIRDYGKVKWKSDWKQLYLNYGSVFVFGNNNHGKLGICSDFENQNVPIKITNTTSLRAKQVSAGGDHTAIIDLENKIWTFGANYDGQLGFDDYESRCLPTQIPNMFAKYIAIGYDDTVLIDIKDDVQTFEIDYNLPFKVKYVTAGLSTILIIDDHHNLWATGSNSHGQLGLGDNRDRKAFELVPNLKAIQVSTGYDQTGVIDLNHEIWTFGSNKDGQLGLGDNIDRNIPDKIPNLKAKQISVSGSHTLVVDLKHNIWSFGSNSFGELGLGDDIDRNMPNKIYGLKALHVSAGLFYSMVIDSNNDIWSFGRNDEGQLGLGDYDDRNVPTQISNLKGLKVSAGDTHTVLIGINFSPSE